MVVTIGSLYHCISRWIDSYLRELLLDVTNYIKDSNYLIPKLNNFRGLTNNIFISMADVVVIYLKIKINKELTFLITVLDTYLFKTKPN